MIDDLLKIGFEIEYEDPLRVSIAIFCFDGICYKGHEIRCTYSFSKYCEHFVREAYCEEMNKTK